MGVRRGGLGKGLDALIIDKNPEVATPEKSDGTKKQSGVGKTETKTKVVEKVVEKIVEKPIELKVKISKIEPNKEQPRKNFDEDALYELAESIKQHGVLQPLLVQERKGYYEIIAGERRWRAARIAGLKEVPVIVKKFTEQEIVEISLIENIQRENLNPIEEAIAFKRLLTEFHLKQDEVAERVSKSRTAVTNSMRLLKLDERVQQMVIEEKISTGHARALLGIEDGEVQYVTACKVFDESLSVREVEKLVKAMNQPKKEQKKPEINLAIYESISEQLKQLMGTKVNVLPKNENKGKIEIEYYSTEELERIIDLFMSTK
jgi:ParB family chromosome partitioning protein